MQHVLEIDGGCSRRVVSRLCWLDYGKVRWSFYKMKMSGKFVAIAYLQRLAPRRARLLVWWRARENEERPECD